MSSIVDDHLNDQLRGYRGLIRRDLDELEKN